MILPLTEKLLLFQDADIVVVRHAVRKVASELGFPPTDQTLIATAISEIARNVVNYAKRGEVRIEVITAPRTGIVITTIDAGPGIADIESAMRDGFSTGGGLGLGLPGAKRLMDEFSIQSRIGEGTTVVMKKYLQP